MNLKKIKARRMFVLLLAVLGVYIAYLIVKPVLTQKNDVHVTYRQFYEDVGNGEVTSASVGSGRIVFTKKGDSVQYRTENPDSPLLKEYLMRNGVPVTGKIDADEVFSKIFDYLFYIVFFVILFVLFRKFVSPNTFRVVHHTGVAFKDVVGMDNLKRDMMQIVDIMQHPAEYKSRGVRMPKGILLEGAPGNGKTLFARAFAGEAKINFIPAKATDFESMFMAIGPAKVKLLFSKARHHAPCVIFIDEFDGIGTRRNYSGSAIETENTRIVTALLNELDGFQSNSGILVLAATNSIHALDEALIRPGRFDARFSVPYPDAEARVRLAEMYMYGKNPASECTPAVLAKMFNGFSCAKIESVLNRAALIARQTGHAQFTLDDVRTAEKEQ
ncbi:MAG: ATP-dependent metallopeptidase FtsH/Yme1/Tma family protein [Treponema sp.]